MIAVANQDPPVLETEQYYKEAISYEDVLERHRASAKLGFTSTFEGTERHARWTVKNRAGQPVTGLKGVTRLDRADTKAHDAELALKEVQPGVYEAERPRAQGLFRIRLELEGAEAPYLAGRSQFLP